MTPMYEDQLIRWHNQKLTRVIYVLLGAFVAACGVIASFVLHPQPPPYVIAVDAKTGEPVEAAQPVLGMAALTKPIVYWTLGNFIQRTFRIEQNYDDEMRNMGDIGRMISPGTAKTIKTYYDTGNDPVVLGTKFRQTVTITRTLSLPTPNQYQVDFITTRMPYAGDDGSVSTHWRATMEVAMSQPTVTNPLGIYVTNLDFAPEAQ